MLSSFPALKGSGAYLEDINHCLYLLHVHHRVWGLYGFIDKTVPLILPAECQPGSHSGYITLQTGAFSQSFKRKMEMR